MKTLFKTSTLFAVLLVFAGFFPSCKDKEKPNERATGVIIGIYSHAGLGSILVQIDEKYPIGKTLEYVTGSQQNCGVQLLNDGTYRNVIQVQPRPPGLEVQHAKTGTRISFSYREYRRGEEGEDDGDYHLFITRPGQLEIGLCLPPDVPVYVITDLRIINTE